MRPRAQEGGRWLVLAVLSGLLATLGAMQYRWSTELGRAAAERRQAEVERAARRFAYAVDRELGQAAIAFFDQGSPWSSDPRGELLARLDAWQRDRAGLVSGLLLATRTSSGTLMLEEAHPADASFHRAAWPESLSGLAQALSRGAAAPGERFPIRPGAIVEQPLGLLLPVFGPPQPGRGQGGARRLPIDGVVVVLLDAAYLRERLLPRLVEAQLGAAGARLFEVAVRRRADRSLVFASDVFAADPQARSGDVELPLPGRARGPGGAHGRDEASPWLLVTRHRGSSFEAAVASVERRTLATGLIVLALIGATVLVLVASAQRARRLARQQLEFVTSVTHELNTPLAAIRSAGQNLADGIVEDRERVRRYGELIEQEGSRLTALIAQVLEFAGIESGSRAYAAEPLSLDRLVDDALSELRLVLQQSGLVVRKEIPADLPQVRGDAEALRRVIANLLTNAAKFAAGGGLVTLRAMSAGGGRQVVLRVEDAGPGIPAAERERVFEPFHRGSAAQRNDAAGSGLGLSLVRRIVSAHGGRVHIEEAKGGGAAVVVELPASAEASA